MLPNPGGLPEETGSAAAGLTLSGEAVLRFIPSLGFQGEAVGNYSLRLENTRVQAFAKGDLSGGFSKSCVAKLTKAMNAGDKIEWFNLILASVVADTVTLQVQWKETSSADARSRVIENVEKTLAQTGTTTFSSTRDSPPLHVGITNNSQKQTTISAKGFVIIGYQARPIQPDASP